jgi:hypothetical protein
MSKPMEQLQLQISRPTNAFGENGVLDVLAWRRAVITSLLETGLAQYFPIIANNRVIDVVDGGRLGCALAVGMVNRMTMLCDRLPTYVAQLPEYLKEAGWFRVSDVSDLVCSDVIIWEKTDHRHAGFYEDADIAVSMLDDPSFPRVLLRALRRHHITFNGTRKIEEMWSHPALH